MRAVEELALPIRAAVTRVAGALVAPENYLAVFAPRVTGLGFRVRPNELRMRAARAIVAEWLTALALGEITTEASLRDAEQWFYGATRLPRMAPDVAPPEVEATSSELVFALLPYVLDSLRPGTRREVLRDASASQDRSTRKQLGAFYTPGDVAARMVELAFPGAGDTCFDPTCGTGVFLRHAVMAGVEATHVFGCDIDPGVADAAAFSVLAAAARRKIESTSPWATWHEVRMNLATVDALQLSRSDAPVNEARGREVQSARHALREGSFLPAASTGAFNCLLEHAFPTLAGGATVLLSNPPYAPIGEGALNLDSPQYESLKGKPATAATRAEALLVEHLWRLTNPLTGRGAVVLPLSVASSSRPEFVGLRQTIQARGGAWSFFFFDRAPDALFGDDVKTRNTIAVYRAASNHSHSTTRLLRWTSRTRREFLERLVATPVKVDLDEQIPKIGSQQEAALYEAVRRPSGRLVGDIVAARSVVPTITRVNPAEIYVAATAYNWIGTAREASAFIERGHTSGNSLLALAFADEELADAAYAVLSSRYVYWLWRVESDGFHVTRRFIEELPFSLQAVSTAVPYLAALGRQLWLEALEEATASVNKRRVTISFPALQAPTLDAVDGALVEAFRLGEMARLCDVRSWHNNVVVVDFTEPRRRRALTL